MQCLLSSQRKRLLAIYCSSIDCGLDTVIQNNCFSEDYEVFQFDGFESAPMLVRR